MKRNSSYLTAMTLMDLERCFRIQTAIDAIDTAVASASFPGKAAVRELARQAYEESIAIMRKGAAAALRKAAAGQFSRRNPSEAFVQRLIEIAKQPGAALEHAAEEGQANG